MTQQSHTDSKIASCQCGRARVGGTSLQCAVLCAMQSSHICALCAGMESPDSKATGLYETTCLLGYGMLPLLCHALLCLLVPR